MKRSLVSAAIVCWAVYIVAGCGLPAQEAGDTAASDVPEGKRTAPGLYVTAKQAYEKWRADPQKVKIVDVRTPEEYLFVGHPDMTWCVPLLLQTHQWDAARKKLRMKSNPDFVAEVKQIVKPDDTLLVICRSGARSTKAVNLLDEAGLKNVYNVIDGVEGDKVKDPQSVFLGKRMVNGWKNSGLPWTYDLDPERMRLPAE